MALPERERFSLKALADQWGKSEDYVEQLAMNLHFQHIIVEPAVMGGYESTHFYFDRDLWSSSKDRPIFRKRGVTAEYINPDEHPNGLSWPKKQWSVYIPRSAVEAFEKMHGVDQVTPTAPPSTLDVSWISSKLLRIAVEAYYEIYVQKKLQPGKSHKAQIREWLDKHYPKLTGNAKDHITAVVNRNTIGGVPAGRK